MIKLQIFGGASQTIIKIIDVPDNYQVRKISLMDFLLGHGIPIASTCLGEGVCKKCIVNKEILSCQAQLSKFISQSHILGNLNQKIIIITIDYL